MEPIYVSAHAEQRLQQRGYRPHDIALILAHGTRVHDGFVLRPSDVACVEATARRLITQLHRLKGSFVALAGDTVLSVYRPDRARRRKLLARAV
jgi:hypothetical protein